MDKQLIVDLSGNIDFNSHGRMYLQSPDGVEQVTLMSPEQIDLFSRAVPRQNLEIQRLVTITEIAQRCRDKIADLTDAVVLINTLGGTDTMRATLEWIRKTITENDGKMIGVVAQDAQSLGAIAACMTDEILCLRNSRFMWHQTRQDPKFGSLDEAAEVDGVSREDELKGRRTRNRIVMINLLMFLMRSGNPVPEHLKKRLISSLYIDEQAFEMDVAIVRKFKEEGKGTEVTETDLDVNLYKCDGEFAVTGRELEQMNLVMAKATVEELVQEVRRRGLNVAFPSFKTPQDKFFMMAKLGEMARERNLKVEFFIDPDGDISAKNLPGYSDEKQKRNLRRAVAMVQDLLGRKVGTLEYRLPQGS
ncbi:MAG: hypothetical protein AAB540_03660 [Patescibacteria group bacterium]